MALCLCLCLCRGSDPTGLDSTQGDGGGARKRRTARADESYRRRNGRSIEFFWPSASTDRQLSLPSQAGRSGPESDRNLAKQLALDSCSGGLINCGHALVATQQSAVCAATIRPLCSSIHGILHTYTHTCVAVAVPRFARQRQTWPTRQHPEYNPLLAAPDPTILERSGHAASIQTTHRSVGGLDRVAGRGRAQPGVIHRAQCHSHPGVVGEKEEEGGGRREDRRRDQQPVLIPAAQHCVRITYCMLLADRETSDYPRGIRPRGQNKKKEKLRIRPKVLGSRIPMYILYACVRMRACYVHAYRAMHRTA